MKSFFEWFAESGIPTARPWLLLGKGPSFSKRGQFDLAPFLTMSLNHAVREQPVKVAHIIDADVVDHLGADLERNAEVVVMPWRPHVRNNAGAETLEQMSARHPLLRRLDASGRLLWYNLSSGQAREGSPVVPVRYFSAEAALNLLALAGVLQVRSLGIDGGASYSNAFDDLKDKTLLANGRRSFDKQFEELAKTILRTGVDYAPLDLESPIRVFVATTEAQMLAVEVLEYSIKKHTSMTTQVVPMHRSGIEVPPPRDPRNHPRTPFSFQRFLIPELAGWRGRAIYLDSDMQVFGDMRQLWTLPFDGAQLLAAREPGESGRRPQFSVMLLDCAALDWDIRKIVAALDNGRLTYEQLVYEMAVAERVQAAIDPSWNSLERYKEGETCLLHYTDMDRQPWVTRRNPLAYLWFRDLFEALDGGFIPAALVEEHVARGYVRPSLAYQVEHRIDDPLVLPREATRLDEGYVAPFETIPQHSGTPWLHAGAVFRARLRRVLDRSGVQRLRRKLRARLETYFG
jgi:hypothetical protein